ncbi:MAG TPA: ABC transporter substrate-binding protein [Chloroflexota bacterium]
MNPRAPVRRKQAARLRNLLILGALLAMLLAAVASRFHQEPAMVAVPDTGGTYVEAAVGNPSYLNPVLLQFNQLDRDISSLIFSGLTRFDDAGQIVPDLAEGWEIGDGGRSYTFRLRKNVKWHDRTPFTADDVSFTVKAVQADGFPGSAEVAELWRGVDVQQPDDFTVKFTLKDPFAPFLEYTTMGIIPRHLFTDAVGKAMGSSPYNLQPVGTGPFRLSRISSDGVTLEPAPDYYGPVPHLSQLRFKFYPDYSTALAGLQNGEVDGLPYVDPQDVAKLAANEKLRIYSTPDYLKYSILFLNNDAPIFKDKLVRQAVSYGIDKEKIIQSVMAGQGDAGKGPMPPASWAYDSRYPGYQFDPRKAEALLDSAGWIDSNGDGIREKDGAQLSFVILTNDNRKRIKVGELVAEDLRRIGFKVEVQAAGWTDLLRDFLTPRSFSAVLAEQWLLSADPDLYTLWHSGQIADGFNFAGLNNPQMDRLLDEARATVDRSKRQQLYSQFQSKWVEEAPSVVLYYPKFNWVVSKAIKDVKLTYMVDGSSRFRDAADWYSRTKLVPAEKQ